VRWAAHFDSAFGVDASFQCHTVEVAGVVRCGKDGEPVRAEAGAAPDRGGT
jgi:hypothetical protein